MSYLRGLEPGLPDQSQVRLDQKKKQRSFQETPLYINGTLKCFSSQALVYWGATLSASRMGQGEKS